MSNEAIDLIKQAFKLMDDYGQPRAAHGNHGDRWPCGCPYCKADELLTKAKKLIR